MKKRPPLNPKALTPEEIKQRDEWAAEVDWLMEEIEKQREKPARIFDQTFIGSDGSLRYDFEVYGTGMSVREWNTAHPGDRILTTDER